MGFNLMRYNVEKFISKTTHKIQKFFRWLISLFKKPSVEKTVHYTKEPPEPVQRVYKKRITNGYKQLMFGTLKPMKGFRHLKLIHVINYPFIPKKQKANHNFICPECNRNRFRTLHKGFQWLCRNCNTLIQAQTSERFVLPKTNRIIE